MGSQWVELMHELGRDFAHRAGEHDERDSFVAENYSKLRETGATSAGVPSELGGGGASHGELCDMIRTLAHYCSSTALAFSMHTHLVATLAYVWRSGNPGPEPMLRRVAAEKLILVSSGGSDWLEGSGKLEKVEGGYRFTGRKIFSSGCPRGDVLMTTGVYDDPKDGPTVIHFPLSLKAEGVKILDTWRTLGMRGTGSHDIEINGAFLPDAVMGGVRRPVGKWHPFMHAVVTAAVPVFYGAYLGTAEAARDRALELARRKKDDPCTAILLGELENHLVTAQMAHREMMALTRDAKPGAETSSAMFVRRTILVKALLATVEKALEAAGGQGFYRAAGLERLFRDAQGARFHPLPEKLQTRYTGRFMLGLDLDA